MNAHALLQKPIALSLAVSVVVLAACGADEVAPRSKARANPVPGGAFAPNDVVNLPKPGSARPLDAPAETRTSITQSFMVRGLSPIDVIAYYARELPRDGWLPLRVEKVGRTALRSRWRREDQLLEVTAFAEDGVASAGPTQLDLLLRLP